MCVIVVFIRPAYKFIYEKGSIIAKGATLAGAFHVHQASYTAHEGGLGQLLTVECGAVENPDEDMVFVTHTEDLCLRVEADRQGGGGDGYNEPYERPSAWVYRVWANSKFDGTGQWHASPLTALNPQVKNNLDDECQERFA